MSTRHIKLPIVCFLIMCGVSFSESVNLLPLDRLEINMGVEKLKREYPEAIWGMIKEDDTGSIDQAFVVQEIPDNRFWSSALVGVQSGKVNFWGYIGKKNENILNLFGE